jgi:uncharacterized protein YukE
MPTDPTQLKQRLAELLNRLGRFDTELEKDFQSLEVAWSQLEQVWAGYAYQTFSGSWNGIRQTLTEYNRISRRYESFLRERIEKLEKLESGEI